MTATASVSYYFKGTIVEDRAYFDFTLMLHQFKEAGFLLHELDLNTSYESIQRWTYPIKGPRY
jgi:hypothetical protein